MKSQTSILNEADLDLVCGGMLGSWKTCPEGTPQGGGAGLYPGYTPCASGTLGGMMASFYHTATGKDLPK